ncbi:MAG: polysaccharide biosynthesis protein, partial [Lachnospiraceae bacterium]|nr:polysaccharide biosynthesis protein [Lachnospiraceae bacterium]
MSRVENASRNVIFGILLKGYQVILPFIIRTVMLYYMGIEYLGLNSLFGSILWVLNLAELGVGSAMVYSMYQPIIDKDAEQICALLKLYRTYYRVIGGIIAVVGLAITPFIPYLIKSDAEVPGDVSIYVVYLLNLFCTVISYWLFAYKNSLLVAHQRNDISSKVTIATNTILYGAQILIIIFLKDYYIYLIASIVTQIINNIIVAYCAKKMYPEYEPAGELDKETRKKITQRIKDLFTMKLGNVIVSTADSIIISIFLGL